MALAMAALPALAAAGPGSVCPELDTAAVLQQINTLRAAGAACAPPSQPVGWHAVLATAALDQAQWLAQGGPLTHEGPQGQSLRVRVQESDASSLRFVRLAENLARGQPDLPAVLHAWRDSAAHCVNLLDARVSLAGLACRPGRDGRLVWVLILGRP